MADRSPHPLAPILDAAASGQFPPADGAVEVLPPDGGMRAVVAFTGHAYVLADVGVDELTARGANGFGGSSSPDVLRWLAGTGGAIGSLDVVLVAAGRAGPLRAQRVDLDHHLRVRRAAHHRRDVAVYGNDLGLVVLGRGLAGRRELSVELLSGSPSGRGHGRRLIADGLAQVPAGEPCWAQVAAGNAASLRAFLAVGFAPVCSEVLIEPVAAPLRSGS